METKLQDLSILIVTWNGDDLLRSCLESLKTTCGNIPEIVVVDNAALDSTEAIVSGYSNIKYIASKENLGFAGGNNLGLPLCTRRFVLLLNNDTVIRTSETITQLAEFLDSHEKAGIAQGKLILQRQGGVLDECGSKMSSSGELAETHYREPADTVVETHRVFHAKGACLMFKREILEKLDGILFHSHFRSYGEDVDFCHRAWLAGFEVWYIDTPPVEHLCGASSAKLPKVEVEAAIIANRVFSFLTTFGPYGKLTVLLRLLVIYVIRFTGTTLLGNIRNSKIYIEAFKSVWRRRKFIGPTRKLVQISRTISDRKLFKIIKQ